MITFVVSFLAWSIGVQIYNRDFELFSFQYDYHIGQPQVVTLVATVLAVTLVGVDLSSNSIQSILVYSLAGWVVAFVSEFLLAKIDSRSLAFNTIYRLTIVVGFAELLHYFGFSLFTPFLLMGWHYRNTKYNVVHPNSFAIAKYMRHKMASIDVDVKSVDIPIGMPDFSHAGNCEKCDKPLVKYDVTQYGIFPNTREDVLEKVQKLIDKVGISGGGIIYFPKGKYLFNKKGQKQFLQINNSNIVMEGELDGQGNPQTVLVNCGNLANGERNPWLSPFFITTGENLQKSNWFFGLQFRKKKEMIMGGDRKYDPGNDCNLLTPDFATNVIRDSAKGDDLLYVENSSKVGKYIMFGMYNTDKEASLLRDILGWHVIRPEWKAASRAGEEEAPSFQWLVEVKEIVDSHTIRLVQPLWRDCEMKYEPAIFNVEMLEHIAIRNLKLSSTWNGLFRHHGHKRYYSVWQTLQMDYGWNGIKMKRVAHGNIENVILDNFTNPLYVMDSRNISTEHIVIKGHDGHQGIKFYSHACDNLFRDITFYNHYADMMGGEGNSYGNVYSDVYYLNPCFKPVKYDFHGFSEGPFSPPSYNLFENVHGFAQIHSSGALFMRPSCARTNVWWNCYQEGEKKMSFIFKQTYRSRLVLRNHIGIIVRTSRKMLKKRTLNPLKIKGLYKEAYDDKIRAEFIPQPEMSRFYTDFYLYGMNSATDTTLINEKYVHVDKWNQTCKIASLYDYQRNKANGIKN